MLMPFKLHVLCSKSISHLLFPPREQLLCHLSPHRVRTFLSTYLWELMKWELLWTVATALRNHWGIDQVPQSWKALYQGRDQCILCGDCCVKNESLLAKIVLSYFVLHRARYLWCLRPKLDICASQARNQEGHLPHRNFQNIAILTFLQKLSKNKAILTQILQKRKFLQKKIFDANFCRNKANFAETFKE